jgi:hypothetical protein
VTWDRRLYFPSEGRHAGDFFARKIWRLRLGLNLWTWVPEASMLTIIPPKPLLYTHIYSYTCDWECEMFEVRQQPSLVLQREDRGIDLSDLPDYHNCHYVCVLYIILFGFVEFSVWWVIWSCTRREIFVLELLIQGYCKRNTHFQCCIETKLLTI